jgi:hypothetical protein
MLNMRQRMVFPPVGFDCGCEPSALGFSPWARRPAGFQQAPHLGVLGRVAGRFGDSESFASCPERAACIILGPVIETQMQLVEEMEHATNLGLAGPVNE